MQRRYTLAHLILASVVVLVLTPLMVDAAPPAQIAFVSERDGLRQIYDDGNSRWNSQCSGETLSNNSSLARLGSSWF